MHAQVGLIGYRAAPTGTRARRSGRAHRDRNRAAELKLAGVREEVPLEAEVLGATGAEEGIGFAAVGRDVYLTSVHGGADDLVRYAARCDEVRMTRVTHESPNILEVPGGRALGVGGTARLTQLQEQQCRRDKRQREDPGGEAGESSSLMLHGKSPFVLRISRPMLLT